MADLTVRVPRLIVEFTIKIDLRMIVKASTYENGVPTDHLAEYTYSVVGNMGRPGQGYKNPFSRRVDKMINGCSTMYGTSISTEVSRIKGGAVVDQIVKSEGAVWKYLNSFETASYDEVTDGWLPPAGLVGSLRK